jgi:threonyl-tRNA synthetase
MKGLILNCKNFSFKDIEKSTKPQGITAYTDKHKFKKGSYKKKIVVLVCLEKGDSEDGINEAAKHICHMADNWHKGNKNVLIVPFGHLSKDLASPDIATKMLDMLIKILDNSGMNAELITFGTHKEWMVDVYGYPRATSFFQFR